MSNKTMRIKFLGASEEEMFYPEKRTFVPGEEYEVTISLGKELTNRLNFTEVKPEKRKTEESPEPEETGGRKKKVK